MRGMPLWFVQSSGQEVLVPLLSVPVVLSASSLGHVTSQYLEGITYHTDIMFQPLQITGSAWHIRAQELLHGKSSVSESNNRTLVTFGTYYSLEWENLRVSLVMWVQPFQWSFLWDVGRPSFGWWNGWIPGAVSAVSQSFQVPAPQQPPRRPWLRKQRVILAKVPRTGLTWPEITEITIVGASVVFIFENCNSGVSFFFPSFALNALGLTIRQPMAYE